MQLSREQEEAEAAKAAETDASAMERLMKESLEPPPETEQPPAEPKQEPPPEAKHEEPPPPEPKREEPPPPEPKAEPGKVEAKDTPPELDEFQKELASSKYDLPAGATRHAKEVIKAVKQQADDQHRLYRDASTARSTLEKENEALKAQVAAAAKDREELDRYRPIVETLAIEQNPSFNARYGGQLAQINNNLIANLQSWGLPKETADYIMEHGGPAYFAKDTDSQVPVDENGREIQMSHKDFWEQRVLKQLSSDNQDAVRLAFDDALRVKQSRDAELRNALANRDQYFKNLEAEETKKQATFKSRCSEALKTKLQELGDLAKEKPIPNDATPEQKQMLESYNQIVKDSSARFDKEFVNTEPEALVHKNLGGLLLDAMPKLLALKDTEINYWKSKHAEIEKKWNTSLKAANTSHRQSVQQQTKPQPQFEKNDGRRMEQMMEQLPP